MDPAGKSVRHAAIGAAVGTVIGGGVGSGVGYLAGSVASGALVGGVGGGFSGVIAALSGAKTHAERARHVASALWDVAATFAGTAASLGTAISLQSEMVSTVASLIALQKGEPLSPAELGMVKAAFSGLAWMALSPGVGLQAASVGILFNAARRMINDAFERCGFKAPLMRIASPGYQMMAMDYAALSLALGAGTKGGLGTYKALTGNPQMTTALTAFEGTPEALVSAIGGGAAFGAAMVGTGLAERHNGGLQFAPLPRFTVKDARDTIVSRMVSMARSGHVMAGPMWGLMMWGTREVLASPGGVLDMLKVHPRAIALVSGGLTFLIIGTMANEWFTQIRRTQSGAPGTGMFNQLQAVDRAGIDTQKDRWSAELDEADGERSSRRDGSLEVAILRDVSEAIGAVFMVGSAIDSAINQEPFRMEDSALVQFLEMGVDQGMGSFALALAFQFIAMRAATGSWSGRDDPQSRRAASSAMALAGGGVASVVATTRGGSGWGILPGAALGTGIEVLGERLWDEKASRPGYVLDAHGALDLEGLEPKGRGRRKDEGFVAFQIRKWEENLMHPVRGRAPRQIVEDGAPQVPLSTMPPVRPAAPDDTTEGTHIALIPEEDEEDGGADVGAGTGMEARSRDETLRAFGGLDHPQPPVD